MINVSGLSKGYGNRTLFSDVQFSIKEGERCALVGRNGSGKSTLLKILCGLETADSGSISFPKGYRLGALPQHLSFSKPSLIEEAISDLSESDQITQAYRVEILLNGLGFSEADFKKPPESFSGGYQLRLALCKVLSTEPDLLLLDEPTNYLDILSIRWLEHFLSQWRQPVLFISHDRSFVNAVCTHVLGIKHGKVRKNKGTLQDYEQLMRVMEESHENERLGVEKKKAHLQAFVDRFGAKATKASQAQSRMKQIEKLSSVESLASAKTLNFRFNEHSGQHYPYACKCESVQFHYPDKPNLIDDFTLELGRNERLAIIGKNGSGKSTLLRLIAGELMPQLGGIHCHAAVQQAYFGQTNIERLDPKKTIEQELMDDFGHLSYGQIRKACGAMLFSSDDAKKSISVLSGGEKSRVLLAKILLQPTNFILLDEPTQHLDMESIEALIEALEAFSGSVVLVSHDESVLRTFGAQKLVICEPQGQTVFWGTYDDFLAKNGWGDATSSAPEKPRKRKDRKERAARVQEKSRKLKPVLTRIEGLMAEIERLEQEGKEIEAQLTQDLPFARTQHLTQEYAHLTQRLESKHKSLDEAMATEVAIRDTYQDLD